MNNLLMCQCQREDLAFANKLELLISYLGNNFMLISCLGIIFNKCINFNNYEKE